MFDWMRSMGEEWSVVRGERREERGERREEKGERREKRGEWKAKEEVKFKSVCLKYGDFLNAEFYVFFLNSLF